MLNLFDPDLLVGELSEEIKNNREHEADTEEYDSHWQWQFLKDWVNPNVCFVFDDVNPAEVGGHKDGKSNKTCFSARVFAERREHFHDDEDHNVCVHDMIQPTKRSSG